METKDFNLDLKGLTDDGVFEGYAAVFNNVDFGGDKILPGAFKSSLERATGADTSVRMLWQHDQSQPIGVWDELKEDENGLWGKGRLILDIQRAREVHSLMKAKAIGGLSIGYRTIKAKSQDGVRLLENLDLLEISAVTFPMNDQARIERVKSETRLSEFARRLRDGDPMPVKEFEGILRDAGVPKSMATRIASVGYADAVRSDSEGEKSNDAAVFLAKLLHG